MIVSPEWVLRRRRDAQNMRRAALISSLNIDLPDRVSCGKTAQHALSKADFKSLSVPACRAALTPFCRR
jgi:hypothetical protein